MKIKLLACLLVTLCFGCADKYKKEFVLLVDEHDQITQQTTSSIIDSIDASLNEAISDTEKQKLLDLRERLEYMQDSASAIRHYIYAYEVDDKLLQELIKTKWNKE